MTDGLNVTAIMVGYRDKAGRFAKIDDEAIERLRDAAEMWADKALEAAEGLSPVGERYDNMGRHTRQRPNPDPPRFGDSWVLDIQEGPRGVSVALGNTAPHAIFLFEGTKPHPISPKGPWPLAWQGPAGMFHFAWDVMHPGTDPIDLPDKVIEAVRDDGERAIRSAAERVTVQIASLFT